MKTVVFKAALMQIAKHHLGDAPCLCSVLCYSCGITGRVY